MFLEARQKIARQGINRFLLEMFLIIVWFSFWQFIIVPFIDIQLRPFNVEGFLEPILPSWALHQQPSTIVFLPFLFVTIITGGNLLTSKRVEKFFKNFSNRDIFGLIAAGILAFLLVKKMDNVKKEND